MLDLDEMTPGTLSSPRMRTRAYMRLLSVGGVPLWVRLALLATLPVMIVGGTARMRRPQLLFPDELRGSSNP